MKFTFLNKIMLAAFVVTAVSFFQKSASHADKANAFINSLNADQKKNAVLSFYGLSGHEWAFIPAYSSHPAGIALKDLDSLQQQKANELLRSYLSAKGYNKTKSIMDLEYILRVLEPNNPARIPGNYFIAIYGTPNEDSTWGWSFEGHHVVLNFTVVKDQIAFAPFFLGANPGEVMDGPQKGTRILHEEEDIAYELMNSFTPEQKLKAIFQSDAFAEIVTSNAVSVRPLPEVGIALAECSHEQKAIMNKLLIAYLSSMPDDLANMRFKRIQSEDLNDIHFGWAGSLTKHEPHYYRIEAKTFMIEFDNTQNHANHIHTVWRDFNGDFGKDLLKEHYQHSHQ